MWQPTREFPSLFTDIENAAHVPNQAAIDLSTNVFPTIKPLIRTESLTEDIGSESFHFAGTLMKLDASNYRCIAMGVCIEGTNPHSQKDKYKITVSGNLSLLFDTANVVAHVIPFIGRIPAFTGTTVSGQVDPPTLGNWNVLPGPTNLGAYSINCSVNQTQNNGFWSGQSSDMDETAICAGFILHQFNPADVSLHGACTISINRWINQVPMYDPKKN